MCKRINVSIEEWTGDGWIYMHKIVMRMSRVDRSDYLRRIALAEDWVGNREDGDGVVRMVSMQPERIWLCEFSVVPLFSWSKRMLGEVALDVVMTPDAYKFSGDYDIDCSASSIYENFYFLIFPDGIITRENRKAMGRQMRRTAAVFSRMYRVSSRCMTARCSMSLKSAFSDGTFLSLWKIR